MDVPALTNVMQNINVAILPVIIIPVTGISCLVFYNRLAALNNLIHTFYKDLREIYLKPEAYESSKKQELEETLRAEQKILLRRSGIIRYAITNCFFGLVAFILSAITILLSSFFPSVQYITLGLWILGALFFVMGILLGLFEIKHATLHNINLEGVLLDRWSQESK